MDLSMQNDSPVYTTIEESPSGRGWTQQFGLQKNPFKDTLDTDLFYRTRQHEEAVIKLRIGIEDRHALLLLHGPSGTGKTLVSQVVLQSLDLAQYQPAFVFVHPQMGKGALLAAILRELGADTVARHTPQRLEQLQQITVDLYHMGRRPVIIIDEAHFLKADALHILRTLSNLETEQEKLVSVLLIAEDSLKKRLQNPSYASLRGRITFAVHLQPLSGDETTQLVKYRLLKCKAPVQLLSTSAFEAVHRLSCGVPREVNRLLYNALLEAMGSSLSTINNDHLEEAARKLKE
jgi:type II secretory pathway predicted ATPase ExeA